MSHPMLKHLDRPVRKVHAHKLVEQTAREMAHAIWDEAMSRDNELYRGVLRANPDCTVAQVELRFVRAILPRLLASARTTLAGMLGPGGNENLKPQIYEALLKDAALARGRSGR